MHHKIILCFQSFSCNRSTKWTLKKESPKRICQGKNFPFLQDSTYVFSFIGSNSWLYLWANYPVALNWNLKRAQGAKNNHKPKAKTPLVWNQHWAAKWFLTYTVDSNEGLKSHKVGNLCSSAIICPRCLFFLHFLNKHSFLMDWLDLCFNQQSSPRFQLVTQLKGRAKLGVLYIQVFHGIAESWNGSGWKFCSSLLFSNSRDGKMSVLFGNVCSDEEDVMKLLSGL